MHATSLCVANHTSQRIAIDYSSSRKESTHRKVEPYGITGWHGHWYLIGYCCLRQGYRVFRLDRIQHAEVLAETFEKAQDFDYAAFLKEKNTRNGLLIEVEFQADLASVRQKIPSTYGTLTPTPTGVLYQERYEDVEAMARYLVALNLPFVIHQPPALREALRRLGERMVQIAVASLPPEER